MTKLDVKPLIEDRPSNSETPLSSGHNSRAIFSPPSSQNSPYINSRDLMRLYLRDIGRIALLTKDEEIILAKEIKACQNLWAIREENKTLPQMAEYLEIMTIYDSLLANHCESVKIKKIAQKLNLTPKQIQSVMVEGKKKWASLAGVTVPELESTLVKGIKAKQRMINANLRLVVSIAKKYQNRGLELLDLIQEGTLGLEKAVEKFDYTKGYHFSTYAYWWIRQGMTRAIATQARTIRLPIHITERLNQLKKIQRQLSQKLGRIATVEEIAQEMGMTSLDLRQFLNQIPRSISLEMKVGEDYNTELVELIETESATPEENMMRLAMRRDLLSMLSLLNEREQKILRLRYGFENGKIYSLSDTASIMNLSRERVRQIQAKAIQKLRQPKEEKNLKDYLEIIS